MKGTNWSQKDVIDAKVKHYGVYIYGPVFKRQAS